MDNLQNALSIPDVPKCDFTISPLGPQFSYSVNGTTYNAQPYYDVFTNNIVTFRGQVVIPNGVSISKYHWDMGDGTELYGQNVTYTFKFEAPETRVVFCVTDNFNRTICTGRQINLRAGIPIIVSGFVLQP